MARSFFHPSRAPTRFKLPPVFVLRTSPSGSSHSFNFRSLQPTPVSYARVSPTVPFSPAHGSSFLLDSLHSLFLPTRFFFPTPFFSSFNFLPLNARFRAPFGPRLRLSRYCCAFPPSLSVQTFSPLGAVCPGFRLPPFSILDSSYAATHTSSSLLSPSPFSFFSET